MAIDDEEADNDVSEVYANGHWTYSDDINLDLDFDNRVDSAGNPGKLSGW